MKQFDVTGMTCAACSTRVEKAVCSLDGVTACSVSLLTNSMSVEGNATDEQIKNAVEKAGYQAQVKGEKDSGSNEEKSGNSEEKSLKKRLAASVIILLVLMYFSMGHTMAGLPVPAFFENNFIALGLIQMLLSLCVLIINKRFFINGIKGVKNLAPNMDTLVAMGSGVSFAWSVIMLFRMTSAPHEQMHSFIHELYFESAAMIVTLITVGKMLEARSKGKTTDALKSLMRLAPDTAVIVKDEKEITVEARSIQVGDIFVVRPGDSIPADGVVIKGISAVDEAALTGESVPVDKAENDKVSAGTINQSGILYCRTTGVGKDTMLSSIIKMVSDAASTKAPVAKAADKVAGIFVPAVMLIALITVVIWLIAGESAGFALARGISVLVISCPCALGLATPVAIMVGSGIGAKNGILFKTAASLEGIGKIKIAVLDKTGTVTEGKPGVTDIIPADGISEKELLSLANSLEYSSEHPLGRAVCERAETEGIVREEAESFEALAGNGVRARISGEQALGGSLSFASKHIQLTDEIRVRVNELSHEGKTPLIFACDGRLYGIIAVADTIRDDSRAAISGLKEMGIFTVMLTGDNKVTAGAVGKAAGVDKVIAGVLPEGKQAVVASLQQSGAVAMIGDGINDAPALVKADTGIAIGAGTDVAIDAADIVLIGSRLSDAVKAVRLGRAVLKNIYENLFWAFGYNIIGIPLAAGVFTEIFGWSMNPMFGAAAMSISSFLVVSNALRLNFKDFSSSAHDRKIKMVSLREVDIMTKTMKIEGMMCMHCEARVKKTLEGVDGVIEAVVSHEEGTARLSLSKPVSDEVLSEVITAQDYKVISID